jgi:hypothetical protein
MLKKSKLGLIAALVLAALSASVPSAGALTVTVSPGGRVTGTANTGVQFVFNTTRKTITCTTATFTATLAGGSPLITFDMVPTYSSCRLVGGPPISGPCSSNNLTVTGSTSSGLTPISLTNFICTPTVTGSTCSVRFTNVLGTGGGTFSGRFNNTGSQLSIAVTGQSLAASGSTCSTLPNDTSVTMSSVIPGGAVVYVVTPTQTITAV